MKPRATTSHARAGAVSPHVTSTRGAERLLRYPDGRVRCIRYPSISAESDIQPDQFDVTISYEEDWDSDHWDDIDWAWDVTSQWDRPSPSSLATPAASRQSAEGHAPSKARHTFTSPADLLRTLNSEGYLQAQLEEMQKVKDSYEVHTGCPWVQSRPVFVLIQQQPNSDVPLTYTLRTKVSWFAAENELSKVLGRRRPDGSPIIKVDQLRDGIVLFEDLGSAEQFSNYLEADKNSEVSIAQCDAHELFRHVQEVKSLVVLLRTGANIPRPDQLAVSLRDKQSPDND